MSILGSNGTAFDGSAGGGLVRNPVIQRQWWAAFGSGFIALLPLILSVDLYVDDLERAMDGASDWVRVGRP